MRTHGRKISVIGLGYVGLPVAAAFGKKQRTIGFDSNPRRIRELKNNFDKNGEIPAAELKQVDILFTSQATDLKKADFHIIAVPTPVDNTNRPDLSLLLGATKTVGRILKKGDIVVYESTVYPGAIEEECIPVLERVSKMKCGRYFKVGYSPERINPGDREHTFTKITKIVSGQDAETLDVVARVYGSVVKAGIHRAMSIKVAEAAKVIENTQRDLNIALINELALIFNIMGIDTRAVLEAAGTKWNFLKFTPGLVGGHCIGVDPYYLTHKAEQLGYLPQVILAGRRINDNMGKYIAQQTVKEMIHAGHQIAQSKVTVLGLTFKENCGDIRNSKVVDIIRELQDYGIKVQIHDPMADPKAARQEYGVHLTPFKDLSRASAVVVAVAHRDYQQMTVNQYLALLGDKPVVIDVKGICDLAGLRRAGVRLWRV